MAASERYRADVIGIYNLILRKTLLQGTCTGLRVRCSARTAEVLAAAAGGTATYECTLKGTAAAAEKDLFTLEYKPQVGWLLYRETKVVLSFL